MCNICHVNVPLVPPGTTTINQLPDPDGVYSRMTANIGAPIIVKHPNIRDGNGVLIPTTEYNEKLKKGSVFLVEGYMKL